MSQIIDLLIKNGSCFINGKLEKVDLAVANAKIQEIGIIPLRRVSNSYFFFNLLIDGLRE